MGNKDEEGQKKGRDMKNKKGMSGKKKSGVEKQIIVWTSGLIYTKGKRSRLFTDMEEQLARQPVHKPNGTFTPGYLIYTLVSYLHPILSYLI